jgi:molybdopterin converting factor small subunit
MKVRLLLFALYRDITGVSETEVVLTEGVNAGQAVAELRARDVRFAALPARPVIAVNRVYAELDALLNDGDELALLPPVAGG